MGVRMKPAENQISDESGIGFSRSLAMGLVLSVGFLISAVVFTAKWISLEHDLQSERNSVFMVEASLDAMHVRTATIAQDTSFSDEHLQRLLAKDKEWLYENIGASSVEDTATEMTAHILPGQAQNWGWSFQIGEKAPAPGILDQGLAASLNASLPAQSASRKVSTSFEIIDGQIWLLGISRVGVPGEAFTQDHPDAEIPRFVTGARLTDTMLREIESNFLLQDIDLSFDAPKFAAFLPLQSSTGETAGYLSWLPPTPGAEILRQLPIPVLGAVGFVVIFLLFGSAHIHKNARRLETALGEARAANRHKDQFIATISHELRTPLTSISASVSLLVSGAIGQLPEKSLRILEICSRNTKILSALIEDLLLIGVIDTGTFRLNNKPTEMNDLLQAAVEDFRGYAASKNVTVEVSLEELPVHANIDARRLSQVISNILSNAAKFSPAGEVVRAELKSDAGKVRLMFTDKGIGIPQGRKEDVFGRFRQVDSRDEKLHYGSGLGMSIARDIMKATGGTIDYQSEPGAGTCFVIEVARCAAPKPATGFTRPLWMAGPDPAGP